MEHLRGRPPDRVGCPDAGDPLSRVVPEHDPTLAIDGHDPIRDVREDGKAAFLLERDALVQLRARKRGGGVPGKGVERLDFIALPAPRPPRIDGQDTLRASLRTHERHCQEGAVPSCQGRVRGGWPLAFDVPDRDRGQRLNRVRRRPARGRRARVEQIVRQLSARRTDDELVILEQANDGGIGPEESGRLGDDLVEDCSRIELGGEQSARTRQLLREAARPALALVELAALERAAGGPRKVERQLEVVVTEAPRLREEDHDQAVPVAGGPHRHGQ